MLTKDRMWAVLARRAEIDCDAALEGLLGARRRVAQLTASQTRLRELRTDYAARLALMQAGTHAMGEAMLQRRYLEHVDGLLQQLDTGLASARGELVRAQDRHRAAEAERQKWAHLTEREVNRRQRLQERSEAQELEKIALARFNHR